MEEKLISAYRAFLDNGKTERECIRQIISKAEACGFRDISTAGRAKAGDRLYYLQDGKSIALFIVGSGKAEDGMNILGAHIDSPRLDIKMKPLETTQTKAARIRLFAPPSYRSPSRFTRRSTQIRKINSKIQFMRKSSQDSTPPSSPCRRNAPCSMTVFQYR